MIGRVLYVVGIVLLLLAGIAWYAWVEPTRDALEIGEGMLAKQVCSCVHVAGRSLDACRADQFPSTDPIQVALEGDRVRAFVPLLGERSALYRPGFGCTLE